MGWTFHSEWKTKEDALEGDLGSLTVIDKTIRGNTGYAAVKTNDGKVFGVVALFRREGKEIWIKLMPEDVGPYEFACPKRILNKLTPVDELFGEHSRERAQTWRDSCIAHHNRPRPPKLAEGMKVRFAEPLDFGPFQSQNFIVKKFEGQLYFEAENGKRCRIKGYTKMFYEVVE